MYLIFDIGGTNMRVGVSADKKNIIQSKIVPTPQDFEQGMRSLKQLADELSGREKVEGLAGGIAGSLDKDKSQLFMSPQLPEWTQKPFRQSLEKIFGCLANLENDAALAGLAEAKEGAGVGKNIVAFMTVGTGVGGARIVSGNIDTNALGFEPGHQIIVPDGNLCNCGGKGHLEPYIAGLSLERIYHQKGEDIKDPAIWDEVAKYLAIGLHNTIVHWSPDMMILGGAVISSIQLDKVKRYLKEFLTIFRSSPEIVAGNLGDCAGLLGALYLLG